MTDFSVFMLLQCLASGNSWLGGLSLKDYKIIWKIKMREMEKEILGDLNCTTDKMNRDCENKTLRRCSNYALSKPIVDID